MKPYIRKFSESDETREQQRTRIEGYDSSEPGTLIPVPEGYEWTSNAGGFFSYDKVLNNSITLALYGPQGNKKLQVIDPDVEEPDDLNAIVVNETEEKYGDPLWINYFKTEDEMRELIQDREKQFGDKQ